MTDEQCNLLLSELNELTTIIRLGFNSISDALEDLIPHSPDGIEKRLEGIAGTINGIDIAIRDCLEKKGDY